jgi:hypothetical protein
MDGPDHPAARVGKKDRQAIGGADAEAETRDIGHHRIVEVVVIQQESGEPVVSREGVVHDENIVPMHLADPYDVGRVQTEEAKISAPIFAHGRWVIADAEPKIERVIRRDTHPPLSSAEGVPDA